MVDIVSLIDELRQKLNIENFGYSNISEIGDRNSINYILDCFPKAKSVVSFGYSYNFEWNQSSEDSDGYIAKYTVANFYKMVSKKLEIIAKEIKKIVAPLLSNSDFYRVFVNSKINDKKIAIYSKVGYMAKNSIIFVNGGGIKTILGTLLLNYEFNNNHVSELKNHCGNCDLCVTNCPTNAITKDKMVVKNRCLQHLSSQIEIPNKIDDKRYTDLWKNRFFGCTSCVDICPHNSKNIKVSNDELIGYIGLTFNCEKIINMKKEDYKQNFNDNQLTASWIPTVTLARNGLLNLYYNNKNRIIGEYFDNLDFYNWDDYEKDLLIDFKRRFIF